MRVEHVDDVGERLPGADGFRVGGLADRDLAALDATFGRLGQHLHVADTDVDDFAHAFQLELDAYHVHRRRCRLAVSRDGGLATRVPADRTRVLTDHDAGPGQLLDHESLRTEQILGGEHVGDLLGAFRGRLDDA